MLCFAQAAKLFEDLFTGNRFALLEFFKADSDFLP